MHKNKLIIAAAGSGKTTYLVDAALKRKDRSILITTFTQVNDAGIREKFYKKCKCVPSNVTIQSWFTFLLRHGVRPFQGCMFEKTVRGMLLVNGQSGVKFYSRAGQPIHFSEDKEFERHYFTKDCKIYSDKLSKFVVRCNERSSGAVLKRLSQIFDEILIDEVQDLAGYDLDLLKLFFDSTIRTLLVGDPRQGTYSTNNSAKYTKFKKSDIVHFFEDESITVEKDSTTLMTNYRSVPAICALSDSLFPKYPRTISGNNKSTGHDGVFLVRREDVSTYLDKFKPLQLRDSVKTKVDEHFEAMNFGESKGREVDRVIVYPTQPIIEWLQNNSRELAPTSRAKLYVALTRAKYSVAIICDDDKRAVQGAINFKMT